MMSTDPIRLDALFDEFLEELAARHEVPWNDVPCDDIEVTEQWWDWLEEVFPDMPEGDHQ